MMGKPITMDQLRQDVGNMVEKITKVIAIFRQCKLKMEEYVCLKVIAMVSQEGNANFDIKLLKGCSFHQFIFASRLPNPIANEHLQSLLELSKVLRCEALSPRAQQG